MSTRVWINGTFFDKHDAKISVYDHGLLYGDGVFEGIRIYAGKVFKHAEHIDRLFDSAKSIALKIPLTPAEVIAAVEATVAENKGRWLHSPHRHARPRYARVGPT